jgi:sec-independent protein translocase protein TatC
MPGVWLVCSAAMAALSPIPLVLLLLLRLGVLDVRQLRRYRRHAIIAILVVAMFLTPPDSVTQLLMAVPMYALYELCILFAPRRRTAGPRDG